MDAPVSARVLATQGRLPAVKPSWRAGSDDSPRQPSLSLVLNDGSDAVTVRGPVSDKRRTRQTKRHVRGRPSRVVPPLAGPQGAQTRPGGRA